ncbi:dihydroorotase [Ectothiorhodospira haloalkaliphila]|uniref:dihydroorotase n=1 Tax=Ectothiorhodospira haloalkaliphila TaxID=421628 RepID=UPI001EE8B918|nr:dihydroorotase [Ectothiorhodospira haloalkaliphila]MCG5524205.1 dihydroorotase [Ectothiorhodospira haloalkaliphila]
MATIEELRIRRPDDWHLHVRDGDVLGDAVPHSARQFARAVIMPNLKPPVVSVEQALQYRERILDALPQGSNFNPLMTIYLTDSTSPEEIRKAVDSGLIVGVKLYPAGATTHSDAGVTDIRNTYPTLQAMQDLGLPLLVHGEATAPSVDIFDREQVFIDNTLIPLVEQFPGLKIVLEHITTAQAVEFVREAPERVGATVTPQHILMNRNALFQGGMRPHHFCLPVLKRETHRVAIMEALAEGHPRFFLGTDSAPHPQGAKESACGCAGIFSAPAAIEFYAEAFEQAGALDKLEAFASLNGPAFYGLPVNEDFITLRREPLSLPEAYPFGKERVVPLRAGGQVSWRLVD